MQRQQGDWGKVHDCGAVAGCSLQNDYSVWQKYVGGLGCQLRGSDYVGVSPNDLRMDPDQRSFHIRGVNNAVLQLVSVLQSDRAFISGQHQALRSPRLTATTTLAA